MRAFILLHWNKLFTGSKRCEQLHKWEQETESQNKSILEWMILKYTKDIYLWYSFISIVWIRTFIYSKKIPLSSICVSFREFFGFILGDRCHLLFSEVYQEIPIHLRYKDWHMHNAKGNSLWVQWMSDCLPVKLVGRCYEETSWIPSR